MNKQLATMQEAETAHEATIHRTLTAFVRPSLTSATGTSVKPAVVVAGTDSRDELTWDNLSELLKPTFSNLVTVCCLAGVGFFYCCSCVAHFVMMPLRRRAS